MRVGSRVRVKVSVGLGIYAQLETKLLGYQWKTEVNRPLGGRYNVCARSAEGTIFCTFCGRYNWLHVLRKVPFFARSAEGTIF